MTILEHCTVDRNTRYGSGSATALEKEKHPIRTCIEESGPKGPAVVPRLQSCKDVLA